jgi:aminoglycoside phosphotransferase (APT) family kinase protein
VTAEHALTVRDLQAIAVEMCRAGDPPVGSLSATPFTGGRSNLTYRLDDGTSRWVLRTPPRRGRTPSAHDVAREFIVTRALVPTEVPVPYPVVLCEDESVIGVPFTVTRFVTGTCVQSRQDLEALDGAVISALVAALIETLAALHAVDHAAVGLAAFGRSAGYAERQIMRWTQQWTHVGNSALNPLACELSDRLSAVGFTQEFTGIVHGDYRIDNSLLSLGDATSGTRVEAIVDWELSTIGDPTADVAMMCVYRDRTLDSVLGSASAWTSHRLPNADTLADAYERASGRPLRQWDAHIALAYFKLAVIAAGIDYRYRAGAAYGPGFEKAATAVPDLLQAGLERLRSTGRS